MTACFTAYQSQSTCMISRLTFVSFLVVLTFTVCIIHEFTFILYFNASSSSENPPLLKQISDLWSQKSYTDDWRKVTDHIFIYSAFWDTRLPSESFVRIIGSAILPGSDFNVMKCLIKLNYSSTILEVPVKYEILTEHHNKPSKAIYIKCFLPSYELPTFAAVAPMGWTALWLNEPTWLAVHKLQNEEPLFDIGVCVRPVFNFSDVFRISEFIAYYEALGTSHFTFYDYSASEDVTQYLYELKKENYSIDVLPWSLPLSLSSMQALGQMASINDCVYRSMNAIRYVAIVDLDEFITPRHVMTLQELMRIQDIPSEHAASFVIRSCVFCGEYQQDVFPPVILPFVTQINIRRENFIYPFLIRSKYIVKPDLIEVAGVHYVWRTIPGWKERFVPASQALVHHYRRELCVRNKTIQGGEIDVKSRKYLNPLMRSNAIAVWKTTFSH